MDIRIVFNGRTLSGDIRSLQGDLEREEGLGTAVLVSLFTDARAQNDDTLPAGESDRRGWWADELADRPGDRIGSRRWLYIREKATTGTLNAVLEADRKALEWMIGDGIVKAVEVTGSWHPGGILREEIKLTRPDGTLEDFGFEHLWEGTTDAL